MRLRDGRLYWTFTSILKSTETDIWLIGANYADDMIYWTGGGVDIGSLAGSPPKARWIFEFEGYLMALNTLEAGNNYPQRVRWSERNDPTEWATGNSGYHTLSGEDPITGGWALKENHGVIGKQKSIWNCFQTGNSLVIDSKPRIKGKGVANGRAAVVINGYLFYLTLDGDVEVYDGFSSTSVGARIKSVLATLINPNKLSKCFIVNHREYNNFVLHIPMGDDCDALFIGNYEYFPQQPIRWTRGAFAHSPTCACEYTNQAELTIDEATGTFDASTLRFGDRQLNALAPIIVYGFTTGYVCRYSDVYQTDSVDGITTTAITAYFDTKDFVSDSSSEIYINRMYVYYSGDTLDVYHSIDRGVTWPSYVDATLSAGNDYSPYEPVDIRERSDMIRLRFYNDIKGETFDFKKADIYLKSVGRRAYASS